MSRHPYLAVPALVLSLSLGACATHAPAPPSRRLGALLEGTPLVDGHNDLLIHYLAKDGRSFSSESTYDIGRRTSGQVDLPRLRAGKVAAAIFTVVILDEADREAGVRESMGVLRAIAARYPRQFEVVADAAALTRAVAAGRVAALPGLEGGEQLGGSLEVLRAAHRHGVRAMTLTWEKTNELGDSNADVPRFDGLSPFGAEVVREMNRLGMLVDLSHAADATAADVLEAVRAPVILSHSSARALAPAPRNAPDELLRGVAANGGLTMVTCVPYFTTAAHWSWYSRGEAHWAELKRRHGSDDAAAAAMKTWDQSNPAPAVTVRDVADQVDHVRKVAGIDHVGLGSDFDGMGSFRVAGLEDVSTFPALFDELSRRGWTGEDLRKLAGGNFLRVLRAVEAVSRRPPAEIRGYLDKLEGAPDIVSSSR